MNSVESSHPVVSSDVKTVEDTSVFVSDFGNLRLVFVGQLNKVGSIVEVRRDTDPAGELPIICQ